MTFTKDQATDYLASADIANADMDALKACVDAGVLAISDFAKIAVERTTSKAAAPAAKSSTDSNGTVWHEVNTDTLSPEARAALAEYREFNRAAAVQREKFERIATATIKVPKGKKVAFGYRWGKVSVAIVDAAKASSGSKQARSLADILGG